jgi:hypothetical protein
MVWYKVQNNAPPARPRPRTSGYYTHPGDDTSGAGASNPTAPVRTQPDNQQGGHKPSVWQRMFGANGGY